ncbi:MAG: methyltransferase domain-containing protein [Trichormus sp. ATA11-4-KO1]|jgi:MPBQ/MSBQ methyltransferase|nr:methyltransferase domain-containing protein [Trichormus sp. ATA11-4-KO1]
MSQSKLIHISQATRYQNAAINYYLELTGSSYLHYGYWEPLPASTEDLTLVRLRIAQEAYVAKLLTFIPAGTNNLLDVGCGIGGNAAYLKDRGFAVEGLAPDPFQQKKFIDHTNGQVVFHLTKFEDFQQTHPYDLILFSESSQYIAADDLAQGAAHLLNNGGYLLLADMIRVDAKYHEGIFSNCHVASVLHAALEEAGFKLVQAEDISSQIAPTIDLCIENFRTFGLSTIKYIADLVAIAVPPLHALGRWIFNRWVQKLIVEGLEARTIFERHLCYEIQLWQLSQKDQ